jgi:hypothetical protein
MRERLPWFATGFALAVVLAVHPSVWAQQQTRRAAGVQPQNPTAGAIQNEGRPQSPGQGQAQGETIRGVIGAITAEGETILDYRTNTAVRTQGAFLTIIGSPVKSEADATAGRAAGTGREEHAVAGRKRHNVYIAWLTPRTKITCEEVGQHAKSEQTQRRPESQAGGVGEGKMFAFEQLEVGDHVEIQFVPEESASRDTVHQSQQMRQTHGRHRVFAGYATMIKVMSTGEHETSGTGSERSSRSRSQ